MWVGLMYTAAQREGERSVRGFVSARRLSLLTEPCKSGVIVGVSRRIKGWNLFAKEVNK